MLGEKPKGGRPGRTPKAGERVSLGLRVTPEVKALLDAAAAQSGRSQSQEAELRLERSFDADNIVSEALTMAYGSDVAKIVKVMLPAMNSAGRAVILQRFFAKRKPVEIEWTRVPAAYDAAVQIAREILNSAMPPEEMGHDQFLTINPAGATDFLDNSLQRLYDRLEKRRTEAPAADPSKIFEWKRFDLSGVSATKPKKR
jgi:hypothetical protein